MNRAEAITVMEALREQQRMIADLAEHANWPATRGNMATLGDAIAVALVALRTDAPQAGVIHTAAGAWIWFVTREGQTGIEASREAAEAALERALATEPLGA